MRRGRPQAGGSAKEPSDVVIVSSSPALGLALQHLLENRSDGLTASSLEFDELLSMPQVFSPNLLVLAPQSWHDLALWLPPLQLRFSACPWLLFSEPRVAGLFLSRLEAFRCAFVPTTASPALLRSAIRWLANEPIPSFCTSFLQLLASAIRAHGFHPDSHPLTGEELQCGCAISLGLSDRQISELILRRVTVVRQQVQDLMGKLRVAGREELAEVVQQALTPANVVPLCREFYRAGADRQRSSS